MHKGTDKRREIVCTSPALSELDSRLDQQYSKSRATATAGDAQRIASEQKEWLINIRNKCANESCLAATYIFRIQALSTSTNSSTPLTLISGFANFRTDDYPIFQSDGKLYFSQFDQSGNNFDVMALDIADQKSEVVIGGRRGGKFLAQNDNYLVINEEAQLTRPLVVIDRKSGRELKRIRLQQPVLWATIDGDHLVAIQGQQSDGEALIFELPSLRIIKSIGLWGASDVQFWQGKILVAGGLLAAYDLNLNKQFEISLPDQKPACGATSPLRVYANKAVIAGSCGEIFIFDLPTRQLEHTIPSYSQFYAVAILDGLIFTIPMGEPRQKDNAHVYDLFTGKELAVLPLNGTGLFAKGHRLLVVEDNFAAQSPMMLYEVNSSSIRNGQWRVEHVLSQCKQAEVQFANTKDLYGAITRCRSAGIEGFAGDAEIPPTIVPMLKQYALWLSRTLDGGDDATRILQKLHEIAPDKDIKSALNEVRLKAKVIGGEEVGELSPEEQQTDFAHVFEHGSQIRNVMTQTIEFGAFPDLFHFSGNQIYVGRYGCKTRICDGGATIGVFDRNTLDEISSIQIAPHDEEYQDRVASITSDGKQVYVSVESSDEGEGRPNFFIINKKAAKVVKKAHVSLASTLISDGGKLMSCGCHFTTEQQCVEIDPVTLQSVGVPGKLCIQNEPGNDSVVGFDGAAVSTSQFVAATKDYLVARDPWKEGKPYSFFPKTGGPPLISQKDLGDGLEWPVSVDGNSVVIREAVRGGQLIKLVSIPTGAVRTLFGLPTTQSRSPVPVLHEKMLYTGFGRDLLIFDLEGGHLKRYIKDFIPAGFKNNGFGRDAYQIERLIIDRGRLIALTLDGENSRIIQLSDL